MDILVIICTYYTAIFKGVAEHGLGWGVGFNNLYIITPLHKITNLGLEAKLYVEWTIIRIHMLQTVVNIYGWATILEGVTCNDLFEPIVNKLDV